MKLHTAPDYSKTIRRITQKNVGTCTFKKLIVFPIIFLSLCVCVCCICVCVCVCGCDVDRGGGTLPEKSPDNHGHLCGSVGGGHRVCGGLLQNQVSPAGEVKSALFTFHFSHFYHHQETKGITLYSTC